MKNRRHFILLGLVLVAIITAVSCQKSRYCLCVSTETTPNDTMVVNLDRSMKCDRIMQLGIQKIIQGTPQTDSIHTYTCTKIHKDSIVGFYTDIPYEE